MTWFDVDKEGLKQIFPRKYILRELIANILDEIPNGCTEGKIELQKIDDHYLIIVIDNSPKGFKDLTDAYTLFRYTDKRKNPTVRGRFNAGEKYVLAHAQRALIMSTTGSYNFEQDTERHFDSTMRTAIGSHVEIEVDLDFDEYVYILKNIRQCKFPKGFTIILNEGGTIHRFKYCYPLRKAEGVLPTWYIDEGDNPKIISRRKTEILIYKEDKSYIYEMGIPVQEIDDPFSYDVQQKIPLDQNREMVSEKYLQDIRGITMNTIADLLSTDQLGETFVQEALESDKIDKETFLAITERKYPKAILWSTNQSANERAIEKGYQILHGRTIPSGMREKWKEFGGIQSSSDAFPTKFTDGNYLTTRELTDHMKAYTKFTEWIGRRVLNRSVRVEFIDNKDVGSLALYGNGTLTYNIGKLGKRWFTMPISENIGLIMHELAHEHGGGDLPHLSRSYIDGLVEVFEKTLQASLSAPEQFILDNYL